MKRFVNERQLELYTNNSINGEIVGSLKTFRMPLISNTNEVCKKAITKKNFGIFRNYLEFYPSKIIEYCFYGIMNAKVPTEILTVLNPHEIIALYAGVWKVKFILDKQKKDCKPFFNFAFGWCMKEGEKVFERYEANLIRILNKNMKRYCLYKEDINKRIRRVDYPAKKEFISKINAQIRTPVWNCGGDFHGKVPDYVEENERRREYATKIYSYFRERYEKEMGDKTAEQVKLLGK